MISPSEKIRLEKLFFDTVKENLNRTELENVSFVAITDLTKAHNYGDYEVFEGDNAESTVKSMAVKFAGFYNAMIQGIRLPRTRAAKVTITHWREVNFDVVIPPPSSCYDPLAKIKGWAYWRMFLEVR
jgi:hypothetical protein